MPVFRFLAIQWSCERSARRSRSQHNMTIWKSKYTWCLWTSVDQMYLQWKKKVMTGKFCIQTMWNINNRRTPQPSRLFRFEKKNKTRKKNQLTYKCRHQKAIHILALSPQNDRLMALHRFGFKYRALYSFMYS